METSKLEALLAGTEGARAKADETSALGHLREMAFAQMAFAGQAGGAYAAEGRCLTEPATCLEGYSGPPFLTAPADESWGYRFTIQGKKPSGLKPGLAATFVMTAVPVTASEDKRSFYVDATRFCVLPPGVDPGDAPCPASCTAIE